MDKLFSKSTRILIAIISTLIQVANIFLGNVIVYEATENIKFDWIKLLKNPLFWVIFICTLVYFIIGGIFTQKQYNIDEKLETAISEGSVKIVNIAVENIRKGSFESAKKHLKCSKNCKKGGENKWQTKLC